MRGNYWRNAIVVPALALGVIAGLLLASVASSQVASTPQNDPSTTHWIASRPAPTPPPADQSIRFAMDHVSLRSPDGEFVGKIKNVEFEYRGAEIKADAVVRALSGAQGSNGDMVKCAEALARFAEALSTNNATKAKSTDGTGSAKAGQDPLLSR